jgi:hypothetical protein
MRRTRDCGEAAEKAWQKGTGRETRRLASFADTQCTSLRFVGLRGLRPVPGLRPLRHCLFGQALELAYGCSDDRSCSEELTQ